MVQARPTVVLLVDDSPGDARLIREMLREAGRPGFYVAEVSRLDEACARLRRGGIEVILLDLSLPDAQGLETVRTVVACAPAIPVVVLTGLDDEATALQALHAGAQDYLTKGRVDGAQLSRAIRYAQERKRLETSLHLLGEVSALLASSPDYEAWLAGIPPLAVPRLADLCLLDVLGEDGAPRRVAVAAADPGLAVHAQQLLHYPLHRDRPHLVWRVLGTGEAELVQEVPPTFINGVAQDARHLELLSRFEIRSHMAVPLQARGQTLGVVTFAATAFSGRHYGPGELALAQELAIRLSLALDNARLYQQAKEAIRARDEALSMVTHDLRNPLTAITLGTSLILHGLRPHDQTLRTRLEDIENSAAVMDRLIQDLLDITRIEGGGLRLTMAAVDAGSLLETAAAQVRLAAAERGIRILKVVPESLPPIRADRSRILQVLANLMANALRFTPEGGRVTLRAALRAGEAVLSVEDTGAGIPAADVPHLFDRFWQGRRAEHGGAGLGLAIVTGIVEAHGGQVGVESRPGVGTTFSFTLPLCDWGDAPDDVLENRTASPVRADDP